MLRLLIGLALLPTAGLLLFGAAEAVGGLARRASAFPFLAGLGLAAALWLFGRYCVLGGPAAWLGALVRRLYVFGHELTHALAAWSVGAKVLDFKVGKDGGHVDLSHSNAFIALAPYCVPIYTLAVVLGYRVLLWSRPGVGGRDVFLFAMGLTLGFHVVKTVETIWDRAQPDLAAAGGALFSLSWIALANGLLALALVKVLFPGAVNISASLRLAGARSAVFWKASYAAVEPLQRGFVAQISRP